MPATRPEEPARQGSLPEPGQTTMVVCFRNTGPASVPEMEPNEEISQALDEARQRRKTLHDAIVHLEKSISSPAAGRIPDWTASVLTELTEVRDACGAHVMGTARRDGV